MKIIKNNCLTDEQLIDIKELLKTIHNFDNTAVVPYLSNNLTYFKEMPIFFMAYIEHKLAGFAMIYADEEPNSEADLYVYVLPQKRKQGIASKLLNEIKSVTENYKYSNLSFVTERNFLEKNKEFLHHIKAKIEDSEYQMELTLSSNLSSNLKTDFFIRDLKESDIKNVLTPYAQTFEISKDSANNYLLNCLNDQKTLSAVMEGNQGIIGFCCADLNDDCYIYSLFIYNGYRNKGYGYIFLNKLKKTIRYGV